MRRLPAPRNPRSISRSRAVQLVMAPMYQYLPLRRADRRSVPWRLSPSHRGPAWPGRCGWTWRNPAAGSCRSLARRTGCGCRRGCAPRFSYRASGGCSSTARRRSRPAINRGPETRGAFVVGSSLLFLGWRWRGRRSRARLANVHHLAVLDAGAAFVLLVILVLHGHADGYVFAALEVQRIGGAGVGGEPVLLVDLFAIGFELGKGLVALDNPDSFAVSLDDLQILIVHPDLAFEVALAGKQLLGLDRKGVAADIVDLFLAQILYVVGRDLRRGEHERLHVAQIGNGFGRQADLAEGDDGGVDHLFDALAFRGEDDVVHLLPLAAAVGLLQLHALAIGIVVARLLEFEFLGGKSPDDVLRIDVVGRPGGQIQRRKRGGENDYAHFSPILERRAHLP